MAQLSGSARYSQYTATASQTTFTYDFEINSDAEIKVQQNDTTLTLTNHYTVTDVGSSTGGTVVLVTGATLNDIITLTGNTLVKRTTTFVEGGDYLASAINEEYDVLDDMVSELLTAQGQTLRFDPIIPAFTATIPTPVATKAIKVNAAGTAFEMSTYDPDGQAALAAAQVVLCEAETAKCLAETAKCEAETAKCVAQTALATGFADDASTSETNAAASAASINPTAFGSDLIPDADGTRDIGSSAKEWAEVHTTDAFIYNDATVTGDVTAATFNGAALPPKVSAAQYTQTVAYNVNGGSYSTGHVWQTRPLNTEDYDNIGITLSSNALTLPAGTYAWNVSGSGNSLDWNKLRIRQTSETAATLGETIMRYTHGMNGMNYGTGVFIIAAEETIEVQQLASVTSYSSGLGEMSDDVDMGTNTYTTLQLIKVA